MTEDRCQVCGGDLVEGDCPNCSEQTIKSPDSPVSDIRSEEETGPEIETSSVSSEETLKNEPEPSNDDDGGQATHSEDEVNAGGKPANIEPPVDQTDVDTTPDTIHTERGESQTDVDPDSDTGEAIDEHALKEMADSYQPTDIEILESTAYSSALEQDDMDLLNELKERIKGAQTTLDDDMMDDFDSLAKRFNGVMESIDRIEQIDSPTKDELLSISDEPGGVSADQTQVENDDQGLTSEGEVQSAKQKTNTPSDFLMSVIQSGSILDDKSQLSLTTDSPYTDIEVASDQEEAEEPDGTYIVDESELINNLLKLAMFKKERGDMKEVTEILQMAYQMDPEDEKLLADIKRIHPVIEVPRDLVKGETDESERSVRDDVDIAKVLAPELEDEITSLQRIAASTLKQAEKLMRTSSIPQDKFDDFSNSLLDAKKLFDDKRFHRSNEISIEIIHHLKGLIQENIDSQTQANIDKAREMVEEIVSGGKDLQKETVDKIKEDFDRAVKSYLVDEFERANLLAKRVITKILEFSEPEGLEIRDRIANMRKETRSIKEIPLFSKSVDDLETVLVKAEKLLDKREIGSSNMLMERAQEALDEIMTQKQLYATAQELQIRLNNRVERLTQSGYGLADIKRKIDYLNEYFDQERFEDVITIGGDIDSSLEGLELSRWEKEAKDTFTQLEEMIEYAKDMDEIAEFRERFDNIKARYEGGDVTVMRNDGRELLETIRKGIKTISLTRAKRIAGGIIDARMNISRLRTLNIETIDFERRVRKAKNLIKEENYLEGIRQLDRVNSEMAGKVSHDMSYLKNFSDVHRDALEAIMDRYRDEPVIYMIRRKRIPLIRKLIDLGRYRKALDMYRDIENHFTIIKARDDVKTRVETNLTECKFELYKRKDMGQDITEPLSLYTQATKKMNENSVVHAEFLAEVSRRYCDQFLPAL